MTDIVFIGQPKQDIPDLIAGALGVSRGTAYDLMREALAEQPAPVQGWKLVPVEPTEDMWKAVNKLDDEMAAGSYDGKGCSIEQAWNCLLAAAPQPAQQEPVTDEENEKFSRDVSNFKGADPEATKHALEEFLRNRVPAIGDIRAAGAIRARRNT